MKSLRFIRLLTFAGLALFLGGCASLRPAPTWVCGSFYILEEEPPASSVARGVGTTQAVPANDEEVIVLSNCWFSEEEPE